MPNHKIAVWNCRRGLIGTHIDAKIKRDSISEYLRSHNLLAMGIIEADIHSSKSSIKRRNPVDPDEVNSAINIQGYRTIVPATLKEHGQARLIVLVKENVKVEVKKLSKSSNDLPIEIFDMWIANEKKITVIIYYREHTSGINGLGCIKSQKERLNRVLRWWQSLEEMGSDFVTMGNANLDWLRWNDPT